MTSQLPDQVQQAFFARPDLQQKISQIFNNTSSQSSQYASTVILSISEYISSLLLQLDSSTTTPNGPYTTKKRKLDDPSSSISLASRNTKQDPAAPSISGPWPSSTTSTFESISFSVPQRKKLSLQISSSRKSSGIRALATPSSETPEFGIPWSEIEHVICLPVPEKAQAQKNFCVFPKGGVGVGVGTTTSGVGWDTMVWNAADTKAKSKSAGKEGDGVVEEEEEKTQAEKIVDAFVAAKWRPQEPDAKEFASEVPRAGMKRGEKVYHVKGFRGSKDGYLFFLPNGILWGFKKPLTYFSFAAVDSISYTSVLQRTFNLVITTPGQEYEFSMLDQADFAGIDAYVKRHDLQDASLAEARRAKKYNVNGVKGQDGEVEEEEGEEGELAKAQREAEMKADDDEDDEEDENFDPGSEGQSEGSGSSDEEDEDDGDGGGEDDEDVEEDELRSDKENADVGE